MQEIGILRVLNNAVSAKKSYSATGDLLRYPQCEEKAKKGGCAMLMPDSATSYSPTLQPTKGDFGGTLFPASDD